MKKGRALEVKLELRIKNRKTFFLTSPILNFYFKQEILFAKKNLQNILFWKFLLFQRLFYNISAPFVVCSSYGS